MATASTDMNDFFNARSMLTPGVAGATTTLITASLVNQFDAPGNIVGLVTSFALGMTVWNDTSVNVLQRFVLYVINSFVIFSVAFGLNYASMSSQEQSAASQQADLPEICRQRDVLPEGEDEGFFRPWTWKE